jgi:hypothetical protein
MHRKERQIYEKGQTGPHLQDRGRGKEILGNPRLRRLRRLEQGRTRALCKPEAFDPAISIRLALGLLEQIKIAANKRDVPYQSLIKMWLAEKVG